MVRNDEDGTQVILLTLGGITIVTDPDEGPVLHFDAGAQQRSATGREDLWRYRMAEKHSPEAQLEIVMTHIHELCELLHADDPTGCRLKRRRGWPSLRRTSATLYVFHHPIQPPLVSPLANVPHLERWRTGRPDARCRQKERAAKRG